MGIIIIIIYYYYYPISRKFLGGGAGPWKLSTVERKPEMTSQSAMRSDGSVYIVSIPQFRIQLINARVRPTAF